MVSLQVQLDDETYSVVDAPAGDSVKDEPQGKTDEAAPSADAPETKRDGEEGEVTAADSDVDAEKKKDEEKIIVGMVCDMKNMYQKWDKHNRFTWTEEYPDDLEEAAENEQTVKYAILVRNKKSYDSRKKLEIDSIVIQSPLLKNVLHDVLKNYPGVTTTLTRLTFSAPFKPFVHRWGELTKALHNDEFDEITKSHVKLLYDVLQEELKDVISAVGDYTKNEVVTYEHVWTIFQPGCTVFSSRYGRPVASRLDQGNYVEHNRYGPCFLIKSDRVDWDGSKFGYDTTQQVILPFVGTIPITDLDCYPLEFHADHEPMKQELLARGRLFEQLAGYHYKSYSGTAIEQKQWGPSKTTIEGRIVIDAYAHSKFNPNEMRNLTALTRVEAFRNAQISADEDDGNGGFGQIVNHYYGDENEDRDVPMDKNAKPLPLTEEQLVLCTPMLKGYALKSKKWLEFFVDCVGEVAFDERAFDSLVLPEGHKQLILAFAQSQVEHKDRFDDDISGKGKGMIMLLSGGPGIGKTLTAESVAEAMRVPLYVMSAGDLGVSSYHVEDNLARVLEMAAKWDAVLLLDECDVFLESRSAHDLDRNRIVSIFLRTLEYYEGILFLTTNRLRDVDDAFHSRIHVSLEYPPLDRPARKRVWQGFLQRYDQGADGIPGHELTDAEVDRLAKLEINGRQIKNVLKTSGLLACHGGQKLSFEHLKTVLKVEGFNVGR